MGNVLSFEKKSEENPNGIKIIPANILYSAFRFRTVRTLNTGHIRGNW